jgi:hypothetical protein
MVVATEGKAAKPQGCILERVLAGVNRFPVGKLFDKKKALD